MRKSKKQDQSDSSISPTSRKRIDLGRLKTFVIEKLPPDSIVRAIILEEGDSLTAQEFVTKVEVWLKLLRRDKSRD